MASVAFVVAILSIFTIAVGVVIASIVLAAGPRRGTNRSLAALIALKAVTVPPAAFGTLVDDRFWDYHVQLGFISVAFLVLTVYPWFLGQALDTPLTRPLRRPRVRTILIVGSLVGLALPWLAPDSFLVGPGTHSDDFGWNWDEGPAFQTAGLGYIVVLLYALVAAVSAFRRTSPGTLARRRAKAYLIAFTTQDVGVALTLAYWLTHPTAYTAVNIANIVLNLTFGVLVATALLRYQLFDFELKVKAGAARGAVAAVLLGTFVLASAVAYEYLQQYGFLVGGAAVGLLLFVIAPIRRAAEALADRLFPSASENSDYIVRKKVEVYREALEEAMLPTGELDPNRAATLRKLRTDMGLTQRDHEVVLGALAAAPTLRGAGRVAPGATVLGKYRVERELGTGGGGRAFLASDLRMDRRVVLKTLPGGDHAAIVREARVAAAVEHPNVVRIYDVEDLGAEAVLVMEYVDGGSLRERLAVGGPLSDAAFARIADDVLAALEAVHAAGAVHRDVKPSNILLTRDGRAKLADFGIARMPGFEATIGAPTAGTVQYMSPEQARGKRLTASSDLYSAAATIYESRTGRPVVEVLPDESLAEMQMRVGAGRKFTGNVNPPALQDWFSRALAPEERYSSAAEMRQALAAALR